MHKFSVVLSVYSKANPQHASEAMHSIWSSQTLKPDEIVLVQDGSLTEALDAEIEKWKNTLGTVLKVVPLEKCSGLGNALHIGLEACSHDLVARMDTDDISCHDRFQKQINFLEQNPAVDIVGSAITEFLDDPTVITLTRYVPLHHEQILKFAKLRCPFNHPSVMFKKNAALKAGNYGNFSWMQDYELWVRMLLNGAIMQNLEEPLVKMRRRRSRSNRRGYRYAIKEYEMQKIFYRIGFLSSRELVRNLLIRIPIRMSPSFIVRLAYTFIRTRSYSDRQ